MAPAGVRPAAVAVPVANAAGVACIQGPRPPTTDVHVRLRRGGPAAVLGAGKVARNELLMRRRRPTISGQATGRKAALPPNP